METVSVRRQQLAVGLLSLCYLVSLIDRLVINLLVDPIRADLALSDLQIALIQGPAFAVLYAAAGAPLGYLADRTDRRALAAAAIGFWSLCSAATGAAANFATLALARLGVGAGEAALTPAAYSLFADMLPPGRLGRAIAVYTAAGAVGSGAALLGGGLIYGALSGLDPSIAPWRLTLIAVSAPGLVLALLVMVFVREPRRRGAGAAPGYRLVAAHLAAGKAFYGGLFLAYAALCTLLYGFLVWMPSILIRELGLSPAQAGVRFGLVMLVAGAVGPLLGGWLADRWRETRGLRAPMLVMTAGFCLAAAAAALTPFAHAPPPMLLLAGVFAAAATGLLGLPPLAIQLSTPAAMRGTVSGVNLMIGNLIGLGAGPVLVVLLGGGRLATGFLAVGLLAGGVGLVACRLALVAAGGARHGRLRTSEAGH